MTTFDSRVNAGDVMRTGYHVRIDSPAARTINSQAIGDALTTNTKQLAMEDGKLVLKDKKPTPEQQAARDKFDNLKSSAGATYKEAQLALAKIKSKYEGNTKYQSKFESEQPKEILIYMAPYTAFDPHKLPEPDKSDYFKAIATVMEIEQNNSALFLETGLAPTKQPPTNYAQRDFNLEFFGR